MFIAITQRRDANKFGKPIDTLESAYFNFFEGFGAQLLPLPNSTKNVSNYFELPIQGLILSGGNDLSPELYGESDRSGLTCSDTRDTLERALLDLALAKKLPVFGICRGMQFINTYFGGSLVGNLKDLSKPDVNHVNVFHQVIITEQDLAANLKHTDLLVNSFHNQGITLDDLAGPLEPFAMAANGVVEGLFHPDHSIAAVQWHPERSVKDTNLDRLLIDSFLQKKLFWK